LHFGVSPEVSFGYTIFDSSRGNFYFSGPYFTPPLFFGQSGEKAKHTSLDLLRWLNNLLYDTIGKQTIYD
jgi:hypothetical protein